MSELREIFTKPYEQRLREYHEAEMAAGRWPYKARCWFNFGLFFIGTVALGFIVLPICVRIQGSDYLIIGMIVFGLNAFAGVLTWLISIVDLNKPAPPMYDEYSTDMTIVKKEEQS